MERSGGASATDTRIQIGSMKLTVTNRYPVLGQQAEREARQEISARLYRIFCGYDESGVSEGGD